MIVELSQIPAEGLQLVFQEPIRLGEGKGGGRF